MKQKMINKYFAGRKLLLATMHGKERVLKPLLEEALGVEVILPSSFDTDEFGTFSGEVERELSPLETARRKCVEANSLTGETLVLASEGSFGAHPVMCFMPANEELLVLKDFTNDLEIRAKVVSTQTNFSGNEYFDWEDALYFAAQAGFPSHALIVRKDKNDITEIHKGLNTWPKLKESLRYFAGKHGKVFVETDMRALFNPTRMQVIREAGEKLVSVINSCCPLCEAPGFDIKEVVKGLPCDQCDSPTQSARAFVYFCQNCGHTAKKEFPDEKKKEDPMFCDECNP
jgi:hypothetical protein